MTKEKKQETQAKTAKVVQAKPSDKLVFNVLADIRLPALGLEAKKGDEIELTNAQAAFFINSGQIKRK